VIEVTHHSSQHGWDFEFGDGASRDSLRTLHESVDAAERAVRAYLSTSRGYDVPLNSARREIRHLTGGPASVLAGARPREWSIAGWQLAPDTDG
jgi:hypothetical protein